MKHPPYHLRANKAVDRLLFVKAIRDLCSNFEGCTYYSLSGPFLEDLRIIEHYFPDISLASIESNEQTVRRQDFHKFNRNITLYYEPVGEFIARSYEPGNRDIFWLDYTDLSYARFGEFEALLKSVPPGSIVRITLRAQADLDIDTLEEYLSEVELSRLVEQIEKKFIEEFQQVLPNPYPSAFAKYRAFALTVQAMIQRSASRALDTSGSKVKFIPLHAARYNDYTQMLSVTGYICPRNEIDSTKERLLRLGYSGLNWEEPENINIPALSPKERFHLEKHLPVILGQDAGEILHNELGYRIARNDTISQMELSLYAKYYREYPNFIRLTS